MSEDGDLTGPPMKEDADWSGAPMVPAELETPLEITEEQVMGSLAVTRANDDRGIRGLRLEAEMMVNKYTVTEVDKRLYEGVYALVRLDGPNAAEVVDSRE